LYYSRQGFDRRDVAQKIAAGEIVIGREPETMPGDRVVTVDGGLRYAIEESTL
jgi:hypothetical protein